MDFGTLTLYRRGEHPQPFRLRLGSLSVGSDPAADISVDDALLDHFHARVVCTPAGCQLSDLGSKSGTLVNKERLTAHAPRLLHDGDRIQIGRVGLLYSAPQPAAARVPDGSEAGTQRGEPVAPQGGPAVPQGEPVAPQGEPVAPQGGPVAPQGGPVAPQGGPVAPQGEPVAPQGGPAVPQGEPVAPQDGPRAAASATAARGVTTVAATPADDWAALFQVPVAPLSTQGATLLPGNRRRRRPLNDERDLPYAAEDYLALLPPIYHEDRFLRRFLLIFKAILDPLDRQIAQVHHYFDPRVAPEHLLPWLAAWVDLALDERWPEARRRELIGAASVLYRWRGTRRGLSDYLRIYTGVTPRIVEAGQERRGETPLPPHTFRVIIEAPDLGGVDRSLVERIIELEKPAHTAYQLEIRAGAQG